MRPAPPRTGPGATIIADATGERASRAIAGGPQLRLTDGKGRTVDFRNTVLIMTSNVASDLIQEMARHESKDMKDRLMDALRKTFRRETFFFRKEAPVAQPA